MSPHNLSTDEAAAILRDCPEWKIQGGALSARYRFRDFTEAFAFMTEMAAEAESLQHHPDWSNSYDTVEISLSTHDGGGMLTKKDTDLALKMAAAARRRGAL